RSLPRPSSAPDAKASTVCPKKLGHKDARVHYAIHKQQTGPPAQPTTSTQTTNQKPGQQNEPV
ncbi:hypothetical protein ACFO8L_41310, partial [Sphaerisporangium corydalis]